MTKRHNRSNRDSRDMGSGRRKEGCPHCGSTRGSDFEDRNERRDFGRSRNEEYDRYSGSDFDQRYAYNPNRPRMGEYDRYSDADQDRRWDRSRGGESEYDRRYAREWDRSFASGDSDRYNGSDFDRRHAYNQDRYNRMDWDQKERMNKGDMERYYEGDRYNRSPRNEYDNRFGGADFERGYSSHPRDEHQSSYGYQGGMKRSDNRSETDYANENSSKQVRFDQRGTTGGSAGRDRKEMTERTSQQYSFSPTSKENEKEMGLGETWSDKSKEPDNQTPGKKGKKSKYKKAS